jgi:hypothetical protein|nr:MAG TPA: Protein of unknown function (DUF2857) [Inoviridae sp.]
MRKPFINNTVYRLFNTDPIYTNLALTRLASAPNTPREASYNALVAREHEGVLNTLKRMNPKRIEKLASMCPDVVTYSIDLKILQSKIAEMENHEQRFSEQMQRLRWMLKHKASNQMIMNLCSLISTAEIKKVRLELNTPVVKGRIVMPSIEVRLKVLKAWSQLEKESDIFVRYQQLIDQFPDYSLAQLHSIINDEKFFGA